VETAEKAQCYACDVTLHEKGEEGVLAYATHWEHDLKRRDGHEGLKVAVTGEVAAETFTADKRSPGAAKALFAEAEAWCTARGEGRYHLLKNEINTVFGGAE